MSTRARGTAAAVLALGLAAALGGCTLLAEDDDVSAEPTPPAASSDAATPSEAPLSASPSSTAAAGTGYAVLETDDSTGEPIRYSACRPIRYVTHLDGAPAEVDRLVTEAVATIARATGLRFVDEGTTDEEPDPDRQAQVAQYGDDQWAPVLIAWTDDRTIPDLDGDTVGLAGSQAYTDSEGRSAYVSGDVMLDGPDLTDILDEEEDGAAMVRAVVEHELGHLVGLDHVDDRTQLMFAEDNPGVVEPAAGDLAGLALMGQGPCVEDLATP